MSRGIESLLKTKDRSFMPKVLLASAECAPFSKTGGLADVVGALPKALGKIGCDARIITPYHRVIKESYAKHVKHLFDFYINLGWRKCYVGIEKLEHDNVTVYLVDNEQYFGEKIYLGGVEEGEQYAFFCRAVLEALPLLDFRPDILHCNDWHTAMLPMLAKTQYAGLMQAGIRYLLTIHNISYQGRYDFAFVSDLLGIGPDYYTPEYFELYGSADFLKGGCVFSDRINTVSPSYAEEIKTPYYGCQLEGILNARSAQLSGIINGIDTSIFDPETDKLIPAAYSMSDIAGKHTCKTCLQKHMGLDIDPKIPVFAIVSRMTEQKGFDLIQAVLDDIVSDSKAEVVIIGSGDEKIETSLKKTEEQHKNRIACYIGYNEELSHLVYAGSDFYLMPSRFEPCGLSQMIAMHYGTIPIVRETGGLKDSVIPYNCFTGEGNGFSFANYDPYELKNSVDLALDCWTKEDVMKGLINHAMSADFSFDSSAAAYMKLYSDML